jgi:peroxiredoxin
MSKTLALLVLFVAALALATSATPSVYLVQVNLDPTTLQELYVQLFIFPSTTTPPCSTQC